VAEAVIFSSSGSAQQAEEGRVLAPKFDANGLVTCVTTDARTGELLMVAHMNAQALQRTIQTGDAWYYSRSRQRLWRKGESSGHVQRVVEMLVDCDQDAIWIKVKQAGPGACHTGRHSCFYRVVKLGASTDPALSGSSASDVVNLEFKTDDKAFDPQAVYGSVAKSSEGQ
jgi:phosphoribosyl-AMP cyclohydrolase